MTEKLQKASTDSASTGAEEEHLQTPVEYDEKLVSELQTQADPVEASDLRGNGVARIAAINKVLNTYGQFSIGSFDIAPLKWLLLCMLFLQGYTTGLDGNMSGTPQQYAANEFNNGPLSGTMNTTKSILGAALFVPYARISDRVGRIEAWIFALVVFTVGRIVTASAPNIGALYVGAVLWEVGYSGFRLLGTALTADLSTLRNRTFAMNIYTIPIIINLWISGTIVQKIAHGKEMRWRWDYGIGCITVPFTTMLLIMPYAAGQLIAHRNKTLPPFRFKTPGRSYLRTIYDFAMQLDLVGVLFFAASLVLVLLPLTLAGGAKSKWQRGYIIAMIVVGGCLFFIFLLWEWLLAPAPFIPKKRMELTFYIALAIEFFYRCAVSCETNLVRNVLLIGFNQTPSSTQRLAQLFDFMQACAAFGVGIFLHFWPHPKPIVISGAFIGLIGMGLMYKYRTAYDGGIHGYIAADVLVGLGGGLIRFPMFTLVHAGIPHDQMAVTIGFLFSIYQVGASVGSSVGTAIWTQRLAKRLNELIGPKLGNEIYKNANLALKYKLGTTVRDGVLEAYSEIQRLLVIVALALTALVCVLTFFLRGYHVDDFQSWTDEEREEKLKELYSGRTGWLKRLIGY